MNTSNENDNEIPGDVIIDLLQEASTETKQDYVDNRQRKRVLVIGAVGAGKTSLINMLAGKSIMPVYDTALRSTVDIARILTKHQDVEYEFIDTPGLDGASNLEGMSDEAVSKLILFLASEKQNFNCVLFVWHKGRIDATFSQSTSVFKNRLMKRRVPFILVLTGCEMDENLEHTQVSFDHEFRNYCFDNIVCGTTLRGGALEEYISEIREQMKTQLWHYIVESCHKSFNDTSEISDESASEEQSSFFWFMIKSVVELFAKGIFYGATKVHDLFGYIIVGHDGQVIPAINTDGRELAAQDAKGITDHHITHKETN